jgi:hypothetical protein
MFTPVNILEKLREEELSSPLDAAQKILAAENNKDNEILSRIRTSTGKSVSEETINAEVFSLNTIQKICEDYRLRFLPSKYYKGEIPYEALIRIKEIERTNGTPIKDFMMIAPADLFDLKDEYEDPVLLAPLGDGKFLFIHKWGSDLKWYRKLLYFPIRNFETYLVTLLTLTLMLTFIIPSSWLVRDAGLYNDSAFYYRMMFFGSCITWLFVISFYYGFVSRKNFSRSDWDNVYFNK